MQKPWLNSYPKGVAKEIEPISANHYLELLQTSYENFPDNTAFSNMGCQLTYRALKQKVQALANYFHHEMGLKKGDRLAIMLPNVLQYPVVLFAAWQAGLIVVNVNPLYTERELEHQLSDAKPSAIVVMVNFAHVLEKVLVKTSIEHVMLTEIGDMFPGFKRVLTNFMVKTIKKMVPPYHIQKARYFREALKQGKTLTPFNSDISSQDIAFLQYTGGTTGLAKGAMLSHRNIVANVLQLRAWVDSVLIPGKEIVITALPLYHIFSLTGGALLFSTLGGHNVLITNPRDLNGFVKTLKQWKFTAMIGVNTLYNVLLNHPKIAEVDFSHVHVAVGGGMALQEAIAKRWQDMTHKPLLEGYGLTETSPVVALNPIDLPGYNGTIGLPLPSTQVRLLNEQHEEVTRGEAGELAIKGPQVMQGYWNNPEASAKAIIEDGWFLTGDIATLDENGYLRIVDRKKDMIVVSGFNVYPNEVEAVLAEHDAVLEVAVVGIPDAVSGEQIKAFIVPKDKTLTVEVVRAFCKERLTGYKVPRFVEFRDSLPKNNVGKILRRELR